MMVLLEILILISAVSVTLAPALIRSTLFLMLTFLLSGFYIALLGVELLSLLFLLVYIGAISVLFLFVVMLLQLSKNEIVQFTLVDRNKVTTSNTELIFSILSGIFFSLFLFILYLSLLYSHPLTYDLHPIVTQHDFTSIFHDYSDVYNLGAILFTWYWFAFIIITFIIIVASFGVIVILK